jgi:hypothetical protein
MASHITFVESSAQAFFERLGRGLVSPYCPLNLMDINSR